MKTKNILLIEDCEMDIVLIKESLDQKGVLCEIEVVKNSIEALLYAENLNIDPTFKKPDLIIVNEELITVDGINILSKIKNSSSFSLPVIMLTSTKRNLKPIINPHASCYIEKPLEVNEFVKVIQEIKYFWLTLAT